jgi:polyphosphate kinase 2 (PPK2 family)
MTILDRSWYGRVLVERVDGFASEDEWRRAYGEIVELERFEKRRDDPVKAWKLTEDDWHSRTKRSEYLEALEDMFERTDTDFAPWHLVEGDSKKYARVKVVKTVVERIEAGMRAAGIEPPAIAAEA